MSAASGLSADLSSLRAYIGLGSNLDDPIAQVKHAIEALAGLPQSQLLRQSRLYASPPLGPLDQPDYVNAVVELETLLSPLQLLAALQDIERAQGRVRTRHWGERIIDLDLLLYADWQVDSETLKLPHPGIATRAFVLRPLAELAPMLDIPGQGALNDLLAARAADVCFPLM
ncbi:MAG: 2-amino-4-hydroxy-6-hydroxymethyldihydropteridine diphosphokinase [Gammaproteobacteria bacterium 28-57-27]|nr:MAG: 2-amino-4-hydroxy-6-hydroxymethyldihydropteridine diphosphokinase [Gammaproteobacteria bacterium 28-57-27]